MMLIATLVHLLSVYALFGSINISPDIHYIDAGNISIPHDAFSEKWKYYEGNTVYKANHNNKLIETSGIDFAIVPNKIVNILSCGQNQKYIYVNYNIYDDETDKYSFYANIYNAAEELIKIIPDVCCMFVCDYIVYYNNIKGKVYVLDESFEPKTLDFFSDDELLSFGVSDNVVSLQYSQGKLIDYNLDKQIIFKDSIRDAGTFASADRQYYLNWIALGDESTSSLACVISKEKVESYCSKFVRFTQRPTWLSGSFVHCVTEKKGEEYKTWLYDPLKGVTWCLKGEIWVISMDISRNTITTVTFPEELVKNPRKVTHDNPLPVEIKEEPLVKYETKDSIFLTPTYISDGVVSIDDTGGNLFFSVPKEKQTYQKYKWYRNEEPLFTDLQQCIGSNTPYLWVSLEFEKKLYRDVKHFLGSYTCRCYDDEGNVYTHGPITVVE